MDNAGGETTGGWGRRPPGPVALAVCALAVLIGAATLAGTVVPDAFAAGDEDLQPLPREEAAPVGGIDGTWAVSEAGVASYSIPIEVPPGTGGLEPQLAIGLASGAGTGPGGDNGPLGRNWGLSGLSVIERCSQGPAQSPTGWTTPIGDPLGGADRFCLDGQLLVPVGGTEYGLVGAIYALEGDSEIRVESSGGVDGDPVSFLVRSGDGIVRRYGGPPDLQPDATVRSGDEIRRWNLKGVVDTSNNYLEYRYLTTCEDEETQRNCVANRLGSIRYGAHLPFHDSDRAVEPDREVVVDWVRLLPDDWTVTWEAGLAVPHQYRVTAVRTVVREATVRAYRITYDATTDLGTPLIEGQVGRVTECVPDLAGTGEVCREPTSFNYADRPQPFPEASSQGVGPQPEVDGPVVPYPFGDWLAGRIAGFHYTVLDADGDGRDDILFPAPARRVDQPAEWVDPGIPAPVRNRDGGDVAGDYTYQLALATGVHDAPYEIVPTGLTVGASADGTATCIGPGSVLDYDHDGDDDLLNSGCLEQGIGVYLSDGAGRFSYTDLDPAWAGDAQLTTYGSGLLADLDGDGIQDLVACRLAAGQGVELLIARGDPAGGGVAAGRRVSFDRFFAGLCQDSLRVADIDGDGAANVLFAEHVTAGVDVLRWHALHLDDTTEEWVELALEIPLADTYSIANQRFHLRFLDANGDGLPDVVTYEEGTNGDGLPAANLHLNHGGTFGGRPSQVLWQFPNPSNGADRPPDPPQLSAKAFAQALILDVGNDGRDDVLVPVSAPATPDRINWYVFDGTTLGIVGISAARYLDSTSQDSFTLPLAADADGDGSVDLITAEPGAPADRFGNRQLRMRVGYGDHHTDGLVTTITEGSGRTIDVSYDAAAPDTGEPVYARSDDCGNTDSWCLARYGPLVSEVKIFQEGADAEGDRAAYPVRHQLYSYRDARVAWYGRGSLGFGSRTVRSGNLANNPADGRIDTTVTEVYDAAGGHRASVEGSDVRHWYPTRGRLLSRTVDWAPTATGADGATGGRYRLELSDLRYETLVNPAGRPVTVRSHGTETLSLDTGAGPTPLSVVDTTTAHDGWGYEVAATTTRSASGGEPYETIEAATPRRDDLDHLGHHILDRPDHRHTIVTRHGERAESRRVYAYDLAGRTTGVTLEARDGLGPVTTTIVPDQFGNTHRVAIATDGETRTTVVDWDDRGIHPVSTTNPVGHVSTVPAFDDALGVPLVEADANSIVNRYAYDGFGRLVRVRTPYGDTVIGYGGRDQAGAGGPFATSVVTVAPPGRPAEARYLDAFGQTVLATTAGMGGSTVVTETGYDHRGLPVTMSRPHLPGDTSQGVITVAYDALGRPATVTRPDDAAPDGAAVTTYRHGPAGDLPGFDGLDERVRASAAGASAVIDPTGHTAWSLTDAGGALVATVSDGAGPSQVVNSPFGVPRTVIQPGATLTYLTDARGRTTDVLIDDVAVRGYTYTGFDQVASMTIPGGATVAYRYDGLGRTLSRQVEGQGTARWTYDEGVNAIGRLSSTTAPWIGSHTYRYEAVPEDGPNRGLLSGMTTQLLHDYDYPTGYRYDANGRLTDLTYPANDLVLRHDYDDAGYLTGVADATTGERFWSLGDHDQGHRIGSETFGDGATTEYTFEPLSGRLGRQVTTGPTGTVEDLTYRYDPSSLLTGVRDGVDPDASRYYTYDEANRLSTVRGLVGNDLADPGGVVEEFEYDGAGLLTGQQGVGAYRYDEVIPGAVSAAGDNAFTYGQDGSQITRTGPGIAGGSQTVQYESHGLPSRIVTGSGDSAATSTFFYDADGTLVLHDRHDRFPTLWAGTTTRMRFSSDDVTAEHRNSIRVGSRVVAEQVVARGADGERTFVEYPGTGLLGTRSGVRGPDGVIDVDHGAYGSSDAATVIGGERDDAGFGGHRELVGLGLLDTGGRFYDPGIGRFLTVDPALIEVSTSPVQPQLAALDRLQQAAGGGPTPLSGTDLGSLYGYAGNNPTGWVDPSGLTPTPAGGGVADRFSPEAPHADLVYWAALGAATEIFGGDIVGLSARGHGTGTDRFLATRPLEELVDKAAESAVEGSGPASVAAFKLGNGMAAMVVNLVELGGTGLIMLETGGAATPLLWVVLADKLYGIIDGAVTFGEGFTPPRRTDHGGATSTSGSGTVGSAPTGPADPMGLMSLPGELLLSLPASEPVTAPAPVAPAPVRAPAVPSTTPLTPLQCSGFELGGAQLPAECTSSRPDGDESSGGSGWDIVIDVFNPGGGGPSDGGRP